MAGALLLRGDSGRAWGLYAEGLAVLRAQGDRLNAARGLEGVAVLAAGCGWHASALRLAGAGQGIRGPAPMAEREALRERLAAALAVARAALGADAADRTHRAGRELTLEEATEEALALCAAAQEGFGGEAIAGARSLGAGG